MVNDIEGPQIRKALLPIWLSKPETARRVRQRIGAVLGWAYVNGLRDSEAGVTVHGFRSAFRDWVADKTDYPGDVAEAALAHANSN